MYGFAHRGKQNLVSWFDFQLVPGCVKVAAGSDVSVLQFYVP